MLHDAGVGMTDDLLDVSFPVAAKGSQQNRECPPDTKRKDSLVTSECPISGGARDVHRPRRLDEIKELIEIGQQAFGHQTEVPFKNRKL